MTDLRTAAQQALETLEALQGGCTDSDDGTVEVITVWCPEVIDNLRAALAEPVQEPLAWAVYNIKYGGSKSLHWHSQHSHNGDPTLYKAIPLYPGEEQT